MLPNVCRVGLACLGALYGLVVGLINIIIYSPGVLGRHDVEETDLWLVANEA